jgi:hypothetical protein
MRAAEVMDLRGDHAKLTAATGGEPRIPFERTIAWWEHRLDAS